MDPTRVLVVEDSLTVRRRIVEIFQSSSEFAVVGEAPDGRTAIALCEELRPDLVTLDMMLPVLDGVAVTEHIMAACRTPILVVSASVNRGELFRTYDALAAGAVDVLEKPTDHAGLDRWPRELLSAARVVSRVSVVTRLRPRRVLAGATHPAALDVGVRPTTSPVIVGIGASTGGPAALVEILGGLPPDFALPILLVLHIAEPFGLAMAEWLDAQGHLPVRYAQDGERLPAVGERGVWMAPPGSHLEVRAGRLALTSAPPVHSCRPSVDVLFDSLAGELGAAAVGCLLTGMGRDGAAGLLAMRRTGALTIAQDAATSVVFGMPGEAVRLGAARLVRGLPEIARTLALGSGPLARARRA